MTGIPITNVNNNCSTGSTAFYGANTMVQAGVAECALALGFERMAPGSLGTSFPDRTPPTMMYNPELFKFRKLTHTNCSWGEASITLEEKMTTGENIGPGAPRMFCNGTNARFFIDLN